MSNNIQDEDIKRWTAKRKSALVMDADIQDLLAHIHAYIDRCLALSGNCHDDSSLLDSSSKLIRLFELKDRVGSVPTLVNGLDDLPIIGLLNR